MANFDEMRTWPIDELLREFRNHSITSRESKLIEHTIFVRCTEGLEKSMQNLNESIELSSLSSESLGRKVVALNWVLAIATAVMAIIAGIGLYLKLS